MNKLRTAIRLAKGKWVNATYVVELFNIDICKLMDIFEYSYTYRYDGDIFDTEKIDNIFLRIKQNEVKDEKK